ncbi:MAG TPA: hypothetical protein VM677_06855 [Actinokineospora sp.]|jgi:hypothetical protein|nr:hypothetical protein [Actinokineospora sp.]
MNPVVLAAIAVAVALLVVDLALSLAVTRRLRVHGERLEVLEDVPTQRRSGPQRGASFPTAELTTVDDSPVDWTEFGTGAALVGIFGAECASCRVHLPEFLDLARRLPKAKVLVLVVGPPDAGQDLVDAARATAQVVLDPLASQVTGPLALSAVPMFVALRDGVIADAALTAAAVEHELPTSVS